MDAYTHPDWLGFLKSIRECPRNTVRRLAAADGLDEHGEGMLAEIIRQHIAWMDLPNFPPRSETHAGRGNRTPTNRTPPTVGDSVGPRTMSW